jgi:hypothetical protein
VPSLAKVRRCKLIQLQRIASGVDQMVEVAESLKEVLNVLLIGEIERVPFSFPIERCDGLFNPVRAARRNYCAGPCAATYCATAKPMPDDPPSTTTRCWESPAWLSI